MGMRRTLRRARLDATRVNTLTAVLFPALAVALTPAVLLWPAPTLGALALGICLAIPRGPDRAPRRIVLLLAAFTFSAFAPGSLGLLIQLAALVMAMFEYLLVPRDQRRGRAVVGWAVALI